MKWVVYDYQPAGIKILDLFEAQDRETAVAWAQSRIADYGGVYCDVVQVDRAPALVRRALRDQGRIR